jgi:hypothetical protein
MKIFFSTLQQLWNTVRVDEKMSLIAVLLVHQVKLNPVPGWKEWKKVPAFLKQKVEYSSAFLV